MWRALVLLCACGGFTPSFDGSWVGSMTTTGTCTDGATENTSGDVRWALSISQSEITASPEGGTCGSIMADMLNATEANVRHKSCPPTSTGFTSAFTGDTLKLSPSGDLLVVITVAVGNGAVQCNTKSSGTLKRE